MNFFKKIKFNYILFSLFLLLKKSMFLNDYENNFSIEYGGNGVVLLPKHKSFEKLCIKIPMNTEFKNKYLSTFDDDSLRLAFSDLVKNKGSIKNDIIMYFKISKNKDLKKYIPTFYIPKKLNAKADFIIMDRLIGEKFKLSNITTFNNENEKELQKIYYEFLNSGFEFTDNVEGIYDINKKSLIIYDLGGIVENKT